MGAGNSRFRNRSDNAEYDVFVGDFVPPPPRYTTNVLPPLLESKEASLNRTSISKPSDVENNGYKEKNADVTNNSNVTSSTSHMAQVPNTTDLKVMRPEIYPHLKEFANLALAATEADNRKNYEEALKIYEKLIAKLITLRTTGVAQTAAAKEKAEEKLRKYRERVEKIQLFLKNRNESDNSDDKDELMDQIKSSIIKEKPNIKWSDVAGLEGVKETLIEALILPIKFPHLITGNRKPWKGILLFGLQGTGKSLLAKAAATEANCHTLFSVTPSHVMAKWLGESEKLVKYLFNLAREQKPSIIFIDEVDSFCMGDRKNSPHVGRMKIQFLLEMQGLNSDNDEIIVLGATSNPWNLDDSVLRWFEKKIHIPLPDENARLAILKMSIGNTPNSLHEDDFKILAEKTEGYSGKDIGFLVTDALMRPLKKVQTATHFVRVLGPSRADPNILVDDLLTPCSACEVGAIQMSWMDVPGDKLLEPIVTMDDMLHCLANTMPSAKDEDLLRLKKFMEDFGYES